jgi:tRNA(Ile)-lysidine synthase
MSFSPEYLLSRLEALTADQPCRRWLVALSGGVDSSVLLHAVVASGDQTPVLAIHVDHGLHEDSPTWAAHCQRFAADLGVRFESLSVEIDPESGDSLEAAARDARYRAMLQYVCEGDCLLSGHHESDQAETLLLNLMRGSGPAGLAGIGAINSFGRGRLLRPLLGIAADEISRYAREQGLTWIDDPSNVDTRFDRNFLRKEILPRLTDRWPAAAKQLGRSAELAGEAAELLDALADIDIDACGTPARLALAPMRKLPPPRQRNLLRRAVRLAGLPPIPAGRLRQALGELVPAREDAAPLVTWPGGELRRYRDELFVLMPLGDHPDDQRRTVLPGQGPVSPGVGLGTIALVPASGVGLDPGLAADGLELRFRQGGEQIRVTARGPTRPLKKLLQESGVLPWMRDRLPLLYAAGELVAVGDEWVSSDHTMTPGLVVEWQDKPSLR